MMSNNARRLFREAGTAFAVLAIYVFTLLAPLHQAAAMQRDFAKLGYETDLTWSVCAPLADSANGDLGIATAKCPAAGIAKSKVLPPVTPVEIAAARPTAERVQYFASLTDTANALPDHVGQSRAPPASA